MEKLDIAIVGNGIIGTLSAIELKRKFPNKSIGLIGNRDYLFSASLAAGAMIAVIAEYEYAEGNFKITQDRFLEIGIMAREDWATFLKSTKAKSIVTAEDTLVYLKKNSSNFEYKNYQAVKSVASELGSFSELSTKELDELFPATKLEIEKVAKIENEMSIDTYKLFEHLSNQLSELQVSVIHDDVTQIDSKKQIIYGVNNQYIFKKLLLSAGSNSCKLLDQGTSIMRMFQGIGSAILFNSDMNFQPPIRRNVVRSVNRGGAQCGIHVVPRTDNGLYLGAGNYVIGDVKFQHRIETIRYLFETFENEIVGKKIAYGLTGKFLIGSRPRSLDGSPMIGPLSMNENIYVATGTNRLGLTWAPTIAKQVARWITNERNNVDIFANWLPDRIPLSFGTDLECIEYFIESRLGNSIEHNLLENSKSALEQKKEEFRLVGQEIMNKVKNKYGLHVDLNYHPDNWSALLNQI